MGKLKELINLMHGNCCKYPRVNVDIVDRTGLCVSVCCEVQRMSFPFTATAALRHCEKSYRITNVDRSHSYVKATFPHTVQACCHMECT